MGIEIPDRWLGKPIEGSLDRVLSMKQPAQQAVTPPQQTVTPLSTSTNLNPRDYIQVPQYNIVIAKAEIHKGKNWHETLESLARESLVMPTVAEFMKHWMNVKTAAVDKANVLVYADGTNVSDADAVDLWKYMSSGHRGGSWTWLNAQFSERNGNWEMSQMYGVPPTNVRKSVLQCPIRKDALVDLTFDNQGFPERESALNNYQAGKNIRFYHPRNGKVARFNANSVRANLNCNVDPAYRYSVLGVFACAAGSAPKNSGGNP